MTEFIAKNTRAPTFERVRHTGTVQAALETNKSCRLDSKRDVIDETPLIVAVLFEQEAFTQVPQRKWITIIT